MANKILDHDAQLQLIIDDQIINLPKEGFTIEADYGGIDDQIAIFANGITTHPFWEGLYTDFDVPFGATSATNFKNMVYTKLSIDDVREGEVDGGAPDHVYIVEQQIDGGVI